MACKHIRDFEEAEAEVQRLRETQPLHFKLGDALEGVDSQELAATWQGKGQKGVNKMQFRQKVRDLVPEANFKDVDQLFASLDTDSSGQLEPSELKPALAKLQKGASAARVELKTATDLLAKRHVVATAAREVLTEMFTIEEEASAEEQRLEELTNQQTLETKLGLVRIPLECCAAEAALPCNK